MKNLLAYLEGPQDDAMTFAQYLDFTRQLVDEGRTSGPNQTELFINFTKLNLRRMDRILKTLSINNEALIEAVDAISAQKRWMVLSEPWCGDAAQNLPLIHMLAERNAHIDLKIILRDEHLAIMDEFLTNGGRGIPKLIALNEQNEVEFTWGPRPAQAQQMVEEYKAMPEPKPDYLKFAEKVQKWYAVDKGKMFQEELAACLAR
jgi:hypothetical protein